MATEKKIATDFLEAFETMETQVVMLKEIMNKEGLISISDIQFEFKKLFGNKTTVYKNLRAWFKNLEKHHIIFPIQYKPLRYVVNDDWRKCLEGLIEMFDKTTKEKNIAVLNKIQKSEELRKHGKK